MGRDGTPELAAKLCGEEIARLRTDRGLSRADLIARLHKTLPPDHPLYETISESWLARLETGRLVKVQRSVILAICTALKCTAREQRAVLLFADRNILADDDGETPPVAELLSYFSASVYDSSVARAIIEMGLRDRKAATLSDAEMLEIMVKVVRAISAGTIIEQPGSDVVSGEAQMRRDAP